MHPFKYYHNVTSLPADIDAKLDTLSLHGLFTCDELPVTAGDKVPDEFHPDGRPVTEQPDVLYPCNAPFYLGTPYPSSLMQVPEGYSRTASVAALEWLEKTLEGAEINKGHFNGERLTATIDGTEFHFAFPNTVVDYIEGDLASGINYQYKYASVITVADVSDNNEDWDSGSLPYYMESQARLLLWCWNFKYGHLEDCPTDCFVVRITGNTPGDITVRTVHADTQKDNAIVKRICKRMAGKQANTVPKSIRDQGTWFDRKAQEREDAYVIEDEDFYELVRSYMECRTQRKNLEAKHKQIKEEMEAIAIRLAAQIPANAKAGEVEAPAIHSKFMVFHTPKRTQGVTISPDIIRQYYPEYSDCIRTTEYARGRVTIEAE